MAFDFSGFKLSTADLKLDVFSAAKVSLPRWSRLEARPRGSNLSASLMAQVRDPLWLLTRQWQMGEWEGDDCGTPVFSDLDYDCSLMQTQQQPINAAVAGIPWFNENDSFLKSIDVRVQMADMWLRLIDANTVLKTLTSTFRQNPRYIFSADLSVARDEESLRLLVFYKERSFDGYLFYKDANRFSAYTAVQKNELAKCFLVFEAWVKRTFQQLDAKSNWNEKALEYQYSLDVHEKTTISGTALAKTLQVEEFYDAYPEWYHLKIQSRRNTAETTAIKNAIRSYSYARNVAGKRKLMPTPVQFAGMPESRFWAFEDGGTNFAAAAAGPLDTGRMAIIEFGLIYSNDWSLVPLKIPVGSLSTIRSLKITDSFGFDETIRPANETDNSSWNTWAFFSLDKMKNEIPVKADGGLAILPTMTNLMKSNPLEEVAFVMDEMANLVWGVEKTYLALSGKGNDARVLQKAIVAEKGSDVMYVSQTHVPNNWIPFALVNTSTTQTMYRRGKMLTESGEKIFPNTSLLRYGLESNNAVKKVYDVSEYEITREGVCLQMKYHYGRWINGETFLWKSIIKETGNGEGHSGLAFDQLMLGD